jgi:hypothetical protein
LNEMTFSPRSWRRTSALTVADRRGVAVGHEEDPLEGHRVPGLGVEELDLELGPDLDPVLLSAGLDDCVHGSSWTAWRPPAAFAFVGQGDTPTSVRREREWYGEHARASNPPAW